MTEPNPIMMIMLQANSFVGGSESVDHLRPLPQQLAFGPGDAALLAASDTPLERDFGVLRCVDPSKHAETWPDWEDRVLGLNASEGQGSFVLCEHFSRDDPTISLGWFSRLKILPISTYRYRQTRSWLKQGFPQELPDWAAKVYQDFTDELSQFVPDRVPRSVVCPNCGKREVDLKISRRIVYHGRAGMLIHEGKERFVPIQDPQIDDSHVAQLICTNPECRTPAELEDDEWQLPGISS